MLGLARYVTHGSSGGGNPTLNYNFVDGSAFPSAITFSRGTNATQFDSSGNLVYAPANLLTYSEDFGNAAWVKTRSSITSDATTSPAGTATADKLVEDTTASNTHQTRQDISLTTGTIYTISFFAKAAERTQVRLQLGSGAQAYGATIPDAQWNLSTGLVTVQTSGTAAITAVGNGWFRCTFVATATTSTASTQIFIQLLDAAGSASYTGDGTSGLFLWGAQINPTPVLGGVTGSLSTYYPTTASAYYGPRLDYDPVTLAAQGLLIEEQRTNLTLQSEDFATTWTVGPGVTVSTNATTAPSGTTTADKLQEDATTGSHLVTQTITFTAATHTASVFAKKAERDWIRVLFFDGTNTFSGFFNLTAGTVGTLTGTGTTATIAAVGNGWYRCTVTATTAAGSGSFAPRIALADGNSSYTGVTGNGIFIWGAQLEAGAFPTSYIPTTTTALTRNADVATVSPLGSWYNISAGTLFAEWVTPANDATNNRGIAAFDDGTNNNRAAMFIPSSFVPLPVAARVHSGGVATNPANTGSIALSSIAKSVVAYGVGTDQAALCVNGAAPTTATTAAAPVGISTMRIGAILGVTQLGGHLRRLTYYPVRLTNAALQQITT